MSTSSSIARAMAWNVFAGVGSRTIGIIGTLILARFITPDEYGQVSVAAICVMTASQLSNLQFGQFLIVDDRRDGDATFVATALHLVLGVLALGGVLLLRDVLAPALDAPGMSRFIPGLVVAIFFERVAHVPEKLLARDLRFRLIAITRGAAELTFTALSVGFAPMLGGMAIVVGNLGRFLLIMIVFVAAADRRWLRPVSVARDVLNRMWRFSVPLAFANITDFAAGKWDNLLVSRFNGTTVAGEYNLAFNLSATSTGAPSDQILDVLFPSFTSLDAGRRGPALVRAMACMALLVMPLAFGLAVVAETLVAALFPPRWAPLAPLLAVLSVQAAAVPLASTLQAYCRAQSRTAVVMASSLVRLGLLLGGLIALGGWGPLWACVVVDVSAVAALAAAWVPVAVAEPSTWWPSLRSLLQALLACVPMAAAVMLTQAAEARFGPVVPRWALVPEVLAGAAGYALGAYVFARRTAGDVIFLVRSIARKNPA